MIYLGIDPGISGAIAAICGPKVKVLDTPTVQVKVGKSLKNQIDVHRAAAILEELSTGGQAYVVIEKVAPMPSFKKQKADGVVEQQAMGVTSAFNFGMGFGIWQGICAALGLSFELVHPKRWKANMLTDMSKEKDASRIKAMQLFPLMAKELSRKKDHGRAEAILMAEYGRRTYWDEPEKPKPGDTLFDIFGREFEKEERERNGGKEERG